MKNEKTFLRLEEHEMELIENAREQRIRWWQEPMGGSMGEFYEKEFQDSCYQLMTSMIERLKEAPF